MPTKKAPTFSSFIKIQKNILTFYGLWPYEKIKLRFLYNIHALITVFGTGYLFYITFLMEAFLNGDRKLLSEMFYMFFTQITFLIKLTLFTSKRPKLLKLLEKLYSPVFEYSEKYQEIVTKWWKIADFLVKYYIAVCVAGAGLLGFSLIVDPNEDNIIPFKGLYILLVRELRPNF